MSSEEQDKPWRPADHPRPGPSWRPPDVEARQEHEESPKVVED